jgi:hypothetical protein
MNVRWQVAGYLLASIVLWVVSARVIRQQANGAGMGRLGKGWPAVVLRFAYYVGLPYAALVLGVIPSSYMGLAGLGQLAAPQSDPGAHHLLARFRAAASHVVLTWLPDLGTMAGMAALMCLLLAVVWVGYGLSKRRIAPGADGTSAYPQPPTAPSLVHISYQAIHWSFYRSGIWLLAGDLYLGVVGGILLIGAERLLGAGGAERNQSIFLSEAQMLDITLLIATSVIFYFVPNLWLLIPIHWLLALVSQRMMWLGVSRQQRDLVQG